MQRTNVNVQITEIWTKDEIGREKWRSLSCYSSFFYVINNLRSEQLSSFSAAFTIFQVFDMSMTELTPVSNLLVTLNSSVNIIIYCIFGEKFKRLFCHLFCGHKWCCFAALANKHDFPGSRQPPRPPKLPALTSEAASSTVGLASFTAAKKTQHASLA